MRAASFVLGLILSLTVLGASFFAIGASPLKEMAGQTTEAQSMLTSGAFGLFLLISGIVGLSLAFKYRITPAIFLTSTANIFDFDRRVYHSFKYGDIRLSIFATSYICVNRVKAQIGR